ncbi:MAG: helix-turn-helix domain-containing protein [Ruminococcaceae bacterium]|nr:helix-turn-helix domain-containing protein [Oscillospiraceae bacterium]
MDIPKLNIAVEKAHWSHADNFEGGECEYIKSFVHRNYTIGYHTHSFYELNIVLGGEGCHYIRQMSCLAKPGCVFLIPPHVQHGYINKSGLDVYHMLIHRDFIDDCFAEFKNTEGFFLLFETEPYLRAHYNENMFLTLSQGELAQIKQDIDVINECEALHNANLFINAIAKKILCQLCLLITKQSGIAGDHLQAKKELIGVADCLNYIHQNFGEKLPVSELADKLHMSRSTFIRQFTKICGCSPHEYIQQYRIKKAREYLKDPTKTASFVAQECGFYDASHMRKYLSAE